MNASVSNYLILRIVVIDPSGVWMGPPDKREPKVSKSVFDQPYQSISAPSDSSITMPIIGGQNSMQRISSNTVRTLVTREEDGDRNLDQARSIKEDISVRSDHKISPIVLRKV